MKIYSNKRDMKQQERNVLGWKIFWAEERNVLGWKRATRELKKEKRGAKEKKKGGAEQAEKRKRKEEGRLNWTKKDKKQRRLRWDKFSAFILLRIFSKKNYGELVCVGFNF